METHIFSGERNFLFPPLQVLSKQPDHHHHAAEKCAIQRLIEPRSHVLLTSLAYHRETAGADIDDISKNQI